MGISPIVLLPLVLGCGAKSTVDPSRIGPPDQIGEVPGEGDAPAAELPPGVEPEVTFWLQLGRVDEVDLLFMVDNSNSMREEQANLTANMGDLIGALTAPPDENGDGVPDWQPVSSLHIGVISSDMGTSGFPVTTCDNADRGDDGNARGERLLQQLEAGAPAQEQHAIGQGQPSLHEAVADELVERVVTPDVLAQRQDAPVGVEEPGRVQSAGARERLLPVAQPPGQVAEHPLPFADRLLEVRAKEVRDRERISGYLRVRRRQFRGPRDGHECAVVVEQQPDRLRALRVGQHRGEARPRACRRRPRLPRPPREGD